MASRHIKFSDQFPTARAIPEHLQVGRTAFIDDLEASVLAGSTVLLLEERRVGKSSVATAVLDRIRASDPPSAIALHIDLRDGAGSSKALISRVIAEAKAQNALTLRQAAAQQTRAGAAGAFKRGRKAVQGAKDQFGDEFADGAAAADLLGTLLGGPQDASVQTLLEALDARAKSNDLQVVLFIDEVQDLVTWDDGDVVQRAIQTVTTRPGSRLSFIFAGSEASTIETLFKKEGPLGFVGLRHELPEIELDQWDEGLRPRFAAANLSVDRAQIAQAHVAANGHPLRMMSICAHALRVVRGDEITSSVMAQAIVAAKDHPSWKEG